MKKQKFLIRFDAVHIRMFHHQGGQLQFLSYKDSWLCIADILFASATSLILTKQQIYQLDKLILALKNPLCLKISYQKELEIEWEGNKTKLNEERTQFWKQEFEQLSQKFSTALYFELKHEGQQKLIEFFDELNLPNMMFQEIQCIYEEQYFYIPFEFLSLWVQHFVKGGRVQHKEISTVSIYFDPEFPESYRESLYMLKIIERKNFHYLPKNGLIHLVTAHGIQKEGGGYLENRELESLLEIAHAKIAVFNSCVLAQNVSGIIQQYLDVGAMVIASPFFALGHKTIFPPLFRFFNANYPNKLALTFYLLRIFSPNIYRYFRLFIPY